MKRAAFRLLITVAAVFLLYGCGSSPPSPSNPAPPSTGLACGVERWAVKTLSDPDALRVNMTDVVPTTIAALNSLPAHCSGLPETRTYPEEFRVYETTGIVLLARNEDDRDVHIALADPNDTSQTIVVEVVDPACSGAAQSPHLSLLVQARSQYQSLGPITGKTVRVRGVGFYDFAHGQTGRSRSCIELHPVLAITMASP